MKNHRKKIMVIAGTESTRERILKQLNPLLSDFVDVESVSIDQKELPYMSADLLVITSASLIDEAAPYIDPHSKKLVARRALDFSSIETLYSIPEGTEVLVVNDDVDTVDDVIQLITEVGIDHIRLIPCYPNKRPDVIPHTAITPGEPEYAPKEVQNLIDIGPRIIDLTTVVEILQALDLMDEKAHYVSAKYFETIVRLGKQLYESNKAYELSNLNLNKVLNQVNDGILAFSRDGAITVFNQKCEEIFHLRYAAVIGKKISQVIRNQGLLDFIGESYPENDRVLKIGDHEYAASRFYASKLNSFVVTFQSTQEIVKMEEKLRRTLIQKGHVGKYHFNDIVHQSELIKKTVENAKRIAGTELSTLIYGESGTGKELFASSIHNASPRKNGPFLAVNFSALPEELVESELFGYEEGAFTGAKKGGRVGLFEQANGGTLFLDEIGDTSLKIQARLLRVLQEKEIMKIGGSDIIPVNVRIIAATNKDLMKMCQEGRFREDLYYRLKKLTLVTPPLRKRKEDILLLTRYFIKQNSRTDIKMDEEITNHLLSYPWPGNVRELENTVEYMLAVCDSSVLRSEHLPSDLFDTKELSCSGSGCYDLLSDHGNPEEFLFLLRNIQLRQKTGAGIGRKGLSMLSQNSPFPLSEEQVRRRTDVLMELGLLQKKRGRSGMRLTRQGADLLSETN